MIEQFKVNAESTNTKESTMFVLISLLHINGFINNDSLFSNFKGLKSGKIFRTVNTYYSKVNKEWYNGEYILDVYEDILNSKLNPRIKKEIERLGRINKLLKISGLEPKKLKSELTFDETMKYLNFYLNKNRNYCIDHLFYEIIKPSINTWGKSKINYMFNYDFSSIEYKHRHLDDCGEYCCEYCCGSYDSWVESQNEYNRDRKDAEVKKEIIKMISDFLNTKREKHKDSYKEYV